MCILPTVDRIILQQRSLSNLRVTVRDLVVHEDARTGGALRQLDLYGLGRLVIVRETLSFSLLLGRLPGCGLATLEQLDILNGFQSKIGKRRLIKSTPTAIKLSVRCCIPNVAKVEPMS